MSTLIKKLAVANRGEVAVRIIRSARELNIKTVLLHSEADFNTLAYRLADETVLLGDAPSRESYLNIEKNIMSAKSVGADAIHPGFGFLSENADFAKACQKNKLTFVGPSPECIELFGDKISAKNLVMKIGGPVIPGYQGEDQSNERLLDELKKIGLPVMVKAAGGGGGRGLRIIKSEEEALNVIEAARREAKNSFGSEKVFLERYLGEAKHIEVQVFGDCAGNVYHLYERECSIQRRHQKVIEEAPSAELDPHIREKILKVAVEIAKSAGYQGAGTVEFLVQDGEFFFLEMNTRLQVEHPVTEMTLGVDLVKAQIQTAEEKPLLWGQEDLVPRGHAIECRIYAEDPYAGGVPSLGFVNDLYFPHGPGRRLDIGFESGDEVTEFYDSMIAKVIVHDETRFRAIQKMKNTLRDTVIFGVKTNIPFLLEIMNHPDYISGEATTSFLAEAFASGASPKKSDSFVEGQIVDYLRHEFSQTHMPESAANPWISSGDKR